MLQRIRSFLRSENASILSRSIFMQVGGYSISFALMPVAIAFYDPAEFGMFAVALFMANLIGTYGTFKLEWAVINEHSWPAAHLLFGFVVSLLLSWGVLTFLAAVFAPPSVLTIFKLTRSAAVLASPVAVVTGLALLLQSWGIRNKAFRDVYLSKNAAMVGRQTFQIVLGIFWPSVTALLLAEFAARVLGIQIIADRLKRPPLPLAPRVFIRFFNRFLGRRYGHYSKIAFPSSVIDFIMVEGLAVVLVPLYGLSISGAYWLVQRIFAIPMALIGTVAADVFQGQIARRNDHAAVAELTSHVALLLSAISIVLIPTGIVAFRIFSGQFYNGKWMLSGQIALILLPALVLQFVASPLSRIFVVREMMHYKYIFDATMFVGLAIWIGLTWNGGLYVFQSIAILSGVQSFAYFVYIILSLIISRKY